MPSRAIAAISSSTVARIAAFSGSRRAGRRARRAASRHCAPTRRTRTPRARARRRRATDRRGAAPARSTGRCSRRRRSRRRTRARPSSGSRVRRRPPMLSTRRTWLDHRGLRGSACVQHLLRRGRPAVRALPRRGVGPAGARRARRCTSGSASRRSSPACRGSRSCASARRSARRSRASTRSAVAAFGEADVERLLADAGIVRNRREDRGDDRQRAGDGRAARRAAALAALLWSFAPPSRRPAPRSLGDVPAVTPESTALAKELKRHGFRFVGPTTAYALMQACGLVNDHLVGCRVRADVERARKANDAGPPARPALCSAAARGRAG